ncbi:hypothetical protein Zm00014a_037572 [Zea mays]|nr:hypothetical protein Zm00014a_037572 [Zea mays]
MYPPGTVYAHPSTPPAMHPFGHYPMPTNGHVETHGAAPSAPEMNGASFSSESEGSDDNSQNDSHSKDNDGKEDGDSQNGMSYSASQGVDERELKKQKRKQSNRESARRSRLHKQVLCNPRAEC